METSYPLVRARGSHRELGRQHGEQAAEKIDRYLDYLADTLECPRDELRARTMRFLPLFEEKCPHLLEELAGLAEGADLPMADALAAQLRGELGPAAEGGCTSFVIGPQGTATGETLIGQTSDNPPELTDFAYVLHLQPEDRPPLLFWTFGGMIGYHGLNGHGVAHFANSLGGGPRWKFALAHYTMKRLMLERRTVAEVVRLMRSQQVCSNGNYVLCDGEGGLLDVELTSDGPFCLDDAGNGFIAHANHFLCEPHATDENCAQSLPDTRFRQQRIDQLIRDKFGSITLDDVKTFLSDHENYPVGICRHPHDGENHPMLGNAGHTVAALIAEPARGRLHVTRGNACENPFTEYSLHRDA